MQVASWDSRCVYVWEQKNIQKSQANHEVSHPQNNNFVRCGWNKKQIRDIATPEN